MLLSETRTIPEKASTGIGFSNTHLQVIENQSPKGTQKKHVIIFIMDFPSGDYK